MKRIVDNKISAALLPLVPVTMASMFKFAVIDEVNGDLWQHFFSNYIEGAWIEIISISLVGAIAWMYASSDHEKNIASELAFLVAAPLIALVVCVILRLGAPKMHLDSDVIMVYLPLVFSFIALAFSSVMIREVSK